MCTYFTVGICLRGGFRRMKPKRTLVGFFSACLFGGHTKDKFELAFKFGLAKHTKKFTSDKYKQ